MEAVDKKDESTGENSDGISFKEITESSANTENAIKKRDINKNNASPEASNNRDDSDILKLVCEDDDDDNDDIPGDFFDDFLKEDFMAGLDIVDDDDWDEDKSKLMRKTRVNNKEEKEKTSLSNVEEKGNDNKKVELRRDPEKTRRDIEMDKAKQKKDRENKILLEKIKLSETGLVPPGMEMEVDIPETKQQLRSDFSKDEAIFKNIPQAKHTKSPLTRVPVQNRTLLKPENLEGKRSSLINKFENHSAGRSRSPNRKNTMFKNRTPSFKSREPINRSRSPRSFRVRSKSPRRKSRSPRRRSRSPRRKSRSPRRRSRSPRRGIRRRSKSIDKRKSDRSRSRESRNHRRKEVEKKKSFLQEIAEKLNETSRPAHMMYQPGHLQTEYPLLPHQHQLFSLENPQPLNPMVPSPLPIQYPHPLPVRYDEHFFIGEPHIPPNVANSFNIPVLPNPAVVNSMPTPEAMNNMTGQGPLPQVASKTQEDVKKLFEDKKISLTDFLAVTAKPEVYAASPARLKEKIKVIARCQDAIQYLDHCEKKFSGPLMIQKKPKSDHNPPQYQSPFVKSVKLKLPFTEIPSADKQKSDFSKYIQRFLEHIEIEPEVIVIDDNCATDDETSITDKSPSPKVSPQKSRKGEIVTPNSNYSRNRLQKLIQTDSYKCSSCDERKNRKVSSVGVQTSNSSISFSVSTQVREDDFYPTMSKQSLAALTPAQLLARSSGRGPELDAVQNRPGNYPYPSEPHRMGYPLPRGPGYDPRMNRDHNQWQI